MATTGLAADDRLETPVPPSIGAKRSHRWGSLDVLKGVALWAMVAHHVQKWFGGDVDSRFLGYDHFVVTDLAAPAFTVGLGAAAVVVGARVRDRRDLVGAARRWAEIFLVGVAIDVATHGFRLRGGGVLTTFAVLGLVVTLAVRVGVRHPAVWWSVSAACVLAAVPATAMAGEGWFALLVNGPFSLVVYGVFAAAGAAVACHALGRPERDLPLWRSAAAVLVVGLLAATTAGGVVSPEGVWPPARYPGHLGFTLWGLVGTLVIWALLRNLLPSTSWLGSAAARAGQRTLLVFAAHFAIKVLLQALGVFTDLDTRAWGLAGWALVAAICIASAVPRRKRAELSPSA